MGTCYQLFPKLIYGAASVTHSLQKLEDAFESIWYKYYPPFMSIGTSGVVNANVGQNVTPHNPSLGLFLYHFLHMMVS
jgi:hypothetical protein